MQQNRKVRTDYYKILGLEPDASEEKIKHAYRQLAKKYHPDINLSPDANDRFIEIAEAYEILINKSLHSYFHQNEADSETLRTEYKKARQEAKENAKRYARMKYEKFKQEQEAFKKGGWPDVILTLRYFLRILVFPIIALFIALPLISQDVSEGGISSYTMFWLLATVLIIFVLNNRKNYFRLGHYYYSISEILKLIRDSAVITNRNCYYCRGKKAMVSPYKVNLFRIRNVQLKSYGALYGRAAGIDRKMKTVRIPRSRKAFMVHASCSFLKLLSIIFCFISIEPESWSPFWLPAGIFLGSIISVIISVVFSTKLKAGYLLSPGMLIKILVWLVSIYFLGENAVIMLAFDPMLEAILRFISSDRLFVPLLNQHPDITSLLRNRYQLYLELPVLSVINPIFRWLF